MLSQSIVSMLLLERDMMWETNPKFLNTKDWYPCSLRPHLASTMCFQHQYKRRLWKSWTIFPFIHHSSLHSFIYAIICPISILFIQPTQPSLGFVWWYRMNKLQFHKELKFRRKTDTSISNFGTVYVQVLQHLDARVLCGHPGERAMWFWGS